MPCMNISKKSCISIFEPKLRHAGKAFSSAICMAFCMALILVHICKASFSCSSPLIGMCDDGVFSVGSFQRSREINNKLQTVLCSFTAHFFIYIKNLDKKTFSFFIFYF